MSESCQKTIRELVDGAYRSEYGRVLATLIRLVGDFDLAEDAVHDAFRAALEQWPREGVPVQVRSWLVTIAKFKAIDAMRKRSRIDGSLDLVEEPVAQSRDDLGSAVSDDDLRLIFTCCHPALSQESRMALTLKEVCGLTTEEIARAFLTSPPTVAQRIVRAKSKIREARIPYRVPSQEDLPDRLETVLQVVYLLFNEGYAASSGDSLTRAELSGEAIRLARLIRELLPDPEVTGLLALMLLQESRRAARTDENGDIVLLEDQDRSNWNRAQIAEGLVLTRSALESGRFGPYSIQAAIASIHAQGGERDATDWPQIVGWYDLLMTASPSPVVELNRAVALSMAHGPAEGLGAIESLLVEGSLDGYYLAYAARADMLRRLDRNAEALEAYRRAYELARLEPEKRFLRKRIDEIAVRAKKIE